MEKEKFLRFVEQARKIKDSIQTEEATKNALIMPFFQMLGYNVFNPLEFRPEFTADVGVKKGEKVDYAIFIDSKLTILIECKPVGSNLDQYATQLYRYFSVTEASFAILTNGLEYRFFSDLEKANKMDASPFLTVDLLNLKDRDITEINKFSKDILDVNSILSDAEDLKYLSEISKFLKSEFENPSDSFIKLVLNAVYSGRNTQKAIDLFRNLTKKALQQYISDSVNRKLSSALETSKEEATEEIQKDDEPKVETTISELEGYIIVKRILKNTIDSERVFYRDNLSYFNILIDDSNRKWVCRLHFNQTIKFITIPGPDKKVVRHDISKIDDIYNYSDEIINACQEYL